MNIKRLFALLLSLAMIFSLAACKEEETPDKPEQTTTGDVSQQAEDVFANKEETSLTPESTTETKEDAPLKKHNSKKHQHHQLPQPSRLQATLLTCRRSRL